jgi:hypothetical protein
MKLVSNNKLLLASLGANVLFAGWLLLGSESSKPTANHRDYNAQQQAHQNAGFAKAQATTTPATENNSSNPLSAESLEAIQAPEEADTETIKVTTTSKLNDEPDPATTDDANWMFKAIKEHPEALQAIRSEQDLRVQIEYQAFLKQQALSPGLQDALLKALTERETAPYELNQEDEELMQNEYERHQRHISSLLGPQLSQELQEYEQMMNSRWTMQDMKQLLDSDNNTFTVKKERQLAQIIANARNNTYEDYKDSGALDTQGQTELDNSLPLATIHQDILSKARNLLTTDELAALDKALQHEALQSKTSDIITSIMLKQDP